MFEFLRQRRRAQIAQEPFPDVFRKIVERCVPHFRTLSEEDQRELCGLILNFLEEKSFEGAGGLQITDEIRVTIAAQACLLLLHREHDLYPKLDSIVVYPHAYRTKTRKVEGGVVLESDEVRLGESWQRGTIVLAWDSVKQGAANIFDGHNVTLHEFAHQLDGEDGVMNGTPELESRSLYTAWAQILGDEFEELSARVHKGRPSDIDRYGSTNAAEFFAVVTEMFFEKPRQLKKRHPDLYEQLAAFYRQDPAAST